MIISKVKHTETTFTGIDLVNTRLPYIKLVFLIGAAVCANLLLSDMAFAAAKIDINKGVEGASGWVIDGINAHWSKGVLLAGVGYILFGEGDLRQRSKVAAIGCVAGSGLIKGLLAALT